MVKHSLTKNSKRKGDDKDNRERVRRILTFILAVLVLINVSLRASASPLPADKNGTGSSSSSSSNTRGLTAPKAVTPAPKAAPPPPMPVPATAPPAPAVTYAPAPAGVEPICRIAIENKVDANYDIIESIILRYPLSWEKLGCKVPEATAADGAGKAKPIVVFDVALALHHRESGEIERYQKYFESTLQGKVADRIDGLVQAQFGSIVSYAAYPHSYAALIGASCDSYNFAPWLQADENIHCVLHNPHCSGCTPAMLERSCFTKPAAGKCGFLPPGPLKKMW